MSIILLIALIQGTSLGQPGGDWNAVGRTLGQGPGEYFGLALAWIGDVNFDDYSDWAAGALYADHGPGGNHGRVDVVDGRTHQIIRTHIGNPYDVNLGSSVIACGDIDGDFVADYMASQPGSAASPYGRVIAYSGVSGAVIREYVSPLPRAAPSQFGFNGLASGKDVTMDGVPDLFVGDIYYTSVPGVPESRGIVYCFDGALGAIVWEAIGLTENDIFGVRLALPGDVEEDGFEELLVVSGFDPGRGTIHVLDAHTGQEKWRLAGPNPGDGIGSSGGQWPLSGVGDADGDGLPDFAFKAGTTLAGASPPRVIVVRGYDGAVIREFQGRHGDDRFGWTIAAAGDVDLDGFADVCIGQIDYRLHLWDRPGAATLYSCRDGRVLRQFIGSRYYNFTFGGGLAIAPGESGRFDLLIADTGKQFSTGIVYTLSYDPFFSVDAREISASGGATVTFSLDFPSSEAGHSYRILASNAQPGERSLRGVAVPLAETSLMHRFFHAPPQGFTGLTGTLDAQGDATATLTLAPGAATAWIGRSLKLAAVSYVGPQLPSLSSGPVFLDVVP